MNEFTEPNKLNLKRGDYVLIRLTYPDTATIEEIAENFLHAGCVERDYHNERGLLRVEVEGLESKLGRNWTWQDRIVSVDRLQTIFGEDEPYIEVNTFGIRAARERYNVRNFRGDVTNIGK